MTTSDFHKLPKDCPECGIVYKRRSTSSMDGCWHVTFECGSKWHGWPTEPINEGIMQVSELCGKLDICPLCDKVLAKDLKGEDPSICYMDGWHHKECLDEYNRGVL